MKAVSRNPAACCGVVGHSRRIHDAMAAAGAYHLIKKIPIPGDGGWDYVAADSDARRLYVSHDTEIVVLDLDTGAIVGKITGGPDMHGAAIASEFGRGFISESNPGSVVIFDLKTLAKIGEVRVGDDPNGIIYDHLTKRIFTADRGSKRITAIDAKTGKIAGTIENLGGRTEHLASDEAGHVFLNMQDRNTTLETRCEGFESAGNMAHRAMPGAKQHGHGPRPLAHFHRMPGRRNDGRGGRDIRKDRRHEPDRRRRRCGGVRSEDGAGLFFDGRRTALSRFSRKNLRTNMSSSKMCQRKRGPGRWPSIEKPARCMSRPRNLARARLRLLKIPRPRPPVLPGTFSVLVIGQQ